MNTSLDQYASRNEVNKCIASNLINVIQLEKGAESFEQKCCFCFSKAYRICRDMIENSPVSIYRIPDYFNEASYPYSSDEELVTVMKAVTMSIVHTLASHFDEEWRQANDEFLNTIYSRLWKLSLPSDNKRKTGLDRFTERMEFFRGKLNGCVEIFNTVKGGTQYIDYVIPIDEFNPEQLKTKKKENAETQGKIVSNDVLQELEKVKADNEELKTEVQRWKDELDAYKERKSNRGGINQLQTAHLGMKLAQKLGIVVSNKKDLAPALSKLFGWGQRKLEQEMCKFLPKEEEMALADIFGEISPHLAKYICSKWEPNRNPQNEAPHTENEAPPEE